jgi:hypothetical protein
MPIGPSSKLKGQIAGQTNVRPPREPDMLAAAYLDCSNNSIRSVKTRRHCRRVNLTPVLFSTHVTTSLRVGARPRLSRNCRHATSDWCGQIEFVSLARQGKLHRLGVFP